MDPTPESVAPLVRFAVLRLARRLRVGRDQSALSNNKIAVLGHLARRGTSSPSRISTEENQRPQSLTRPITELEKAGLIERISDTTGARRSLLKLTADGREAFEADMRLRDERLSRALAGLDPDSLRLLVEAARLLDDLDHLDDG
ncbi:MarR family winged helix-turn-helix transcriptional regulator [Actinomyces sp. oral taxon 448]|uniref:MarR family winged helix-turn-helix transcriptional regulator n=1 Tax=Actinomyces sp. oral taxon 448 TaxID=712124 RepID=UPI0002188A8B|nr:MarR family transcriptional regulator [Actinomyces sp. oral taxon 448]EGQ74993.1 regulatory protein [Actinomyces sp. oral taxon 448 str. F0400]